MKKPLKRPLNKKTPLNFKARRAVLRKQQNYYPRIIKRKIVFLWKQQKYSVAEIMGLANKRIPKSFKVNSEFVVRQIGKFREKSKSFGLAQQKRKRALKSKEQVLDEKKPRLPKQNQVNPKKDLTPKNQRLLSVIKRKQPQTRKTFFRFSEIPKKSAEKLWERYNPKENPSEIKIKSSLLRNTAETKGRESIVKATVLERLFVANVFFQTGKPSKELAENMNALKINISENAINATLRTAGLIK